MYASQVSVVASLVRRVTSVERCYFPLFGHRRFALQSVLSRLSCLSFCLSVCVSVFLSVCLSFCVYGPLEQMTVKFIVKI